MSPIPLFVELCAGTAALSLCLHRDGAKPPVSRMGSKSGYANVILRVLGLDLVSGLLHEDTQNLRETKKLVSRQVFCL